MVAHALLPLQPSITAQSQHGVVGEARASKRAGQDVFLFGRRIEPEAVGALDVHISHHTMFLCEIATKHRSLIGAPFLPALNGGVSRSN